MNEFYDLFAPLRQLLTRDLMLWLAGASVLMLVGSALATPVFLARLPPDYFLHPKPHLIDRVRAGHPGQAVLVIVKNLGGSLLLLAGIAMLVLPGQGILTMIMGIVLIDFPGKMRLERWLVSRSKVLSTINRLRLKLGRAPLRLEPADHGQDRHQGQDDAEP